MSQSPIIYEAEVYSREVTYRNGLGETNTVTLHFALDPLELLNQFSKIELKKSRSGNPAQRANPEFTEEHQLKLIRDIAAKAAGSFSEDGEMWEPFEDFEKHLSGKAFLAQLTASDGDRKEFAEKVILHPIRAFVAYAKADPSNSPSDIQMFEKTVASMENLFKAEPEKVETLEEKKARLEAEMRALEASDES